MCISKKIDFALIFTVKNANPNGDPLDGNRPRTTYQGYGEVSDVCLKRKIRNRLLDEGENIFVQSSDNRKKGDDYLSLRDRAESNEELKECMIAMQDKDKAAKAHADFIKTACSSWYDVRAFGQVFAFQKNKKDGKEGSDAVSIGIRGPVSIQSAYSIAPINITSIQITKSVNLETATNPNGKGSDSMGMKHRVDSGVYVTYGAINTQLAQKTGFSDNDADTLKNALLTLFRNDETAARPAGSMEVVKLIWWQHNCPHGQYPSIKVHKSLKLLSSNDNGELSIDTEDLEGLIPEILDGE